MTKSLMLPIGAVIFATSCESRPALTFPSPVALPSPTAPVPTPSPPPAPPPNTREPGPAPIPGTRITPGEVAFGTITGTDPACFPNWDSTGRCRQYELTASMDGTLLATLRLSGAPRGFFTPDLFLLAPDGTWVWAGESWPERQARMTIHARETYRLVVVAYGPFPETFEVSAEVEP